MRITGKLYPFFVGFFVGMILILLSGKWIISERLFMGQVGLFSEIEIEKLLNLQIDRFQFALYCIRGKLILLLILWLFMRTQWYGVVLNSFFIYLGLGLGIFITTAVVRFSWKGIILSVISLFPQYLLYVPALVAFILLTKRQEADSVSKSQKIVEILVILLVVIIGGFLESYVNSSLVQKFIKYL